MWTGNPHTNLFYVASLLNMPTAFAQQLITQQGSVTDYKFGDSKQLKAATDITSVIAAVNRYEPWTNAKAKGLLEYHPVAIWTELSVDVVPRPGVFGRMCTFYGGWGAAGSPTPHTIADMVMLHGAICTTYGGVGDPGTTMATIRCQFDDTMQDLLKTPYADGGRPVFFYCFNESAIADKPIDTDRFMLVFRGTFNVYGRY